MIGGVTVCDRGEGGQIWSKKSVTYLLNGPVIRWVRGSAK